MLKIAVGHSNDPDSIEAVDEAIQQCLDSLGGEIPKAGVLFAAIDFEHELILNQINATFPDLELIGGTTDGEVSSVLGFQQDSLTLMLFCADDIEIRAAVGRNVSQNPTAIAQQTVETLKQIAQSISLALKRPTDLVARYGGEEFAILLPLTDIDGAHQVAETIHSVIEQLKILHATSPVSDRVTLSLGISSMVPQVGLSLETLIATADNALYQAKQEGRNRHCVYGASNVISDLEP